MPLPGANPGHLDRHPQPLFIFPDALMRAHQFRRSLLHAPLELPVRDLQSLLCTFPIRDLAMERFIEFPERTGFPEQVDEDTDFGSKDLRVDRLAEVIDRAGSVSPQDIGLLDHEGG